MDVWWTNHFDCNRRDTYCKLGSFAKPPSLLILTPRPAKNFGLSYLIWKSTLCSLTSKSHFYSPRKLWAAGCIQQLKLLFLQYLAIPGFPQSDQQAQCRHWFTVKHSKADLLTSSHPQNSSSHLLGLQGPQQTPAYALILLYKMIVFVFVLAVGFLRKANQIV